MKSFADENIELMAMNALQGSDMDKLNKEFGTLHSISTVLNMASTVTTGLIGWKIGHVGLGLAGWS